MNLWLIHCPLTTNHIARVVVLVCLFHIMHHRLEVIMSDWFTAPQTELQQTRGQRQRPVHAGQLQDAHEHSQVGGRTAASPQAEQEGA